MSEVQDATLKLIQSLQDFDQQSLRQAKSDLENSHPLEIYLLWDGARMFPNAKHVPKLIRDTDKLLPATGLISMTPKEMLPDDTASKTLPRSFKTLLRPFNLCIGRKVHWELTLEGSDLIDLHETSWFLHVDYGQTPSRDQHPPPPELIYPLGHLIATPCHDNHDYSCTPSWFTVVVDVGNPNHPIWLVYDPTSAGWSPPEYYSGGYVSDEEDKTKTMMQPDWFTDNVTVNRWEGAERAQELFAPLARKADMVLLFDNLEEWEEATHDTICTRMCSDTRTFNWKPQLKYATVKHISDQLTQLESAPVPSQQQGDSPLHCPREPADPDHNISPLSKTSDSTTTSSVSKSSDKSDPSDLSRITADTEVSQDSTKIENDVDSNNAIKDNNSTGTVDSVETVYGPTPV